MKVQIEIDCTAEEARQFFGLPDVRRANETVMGGIESGLEAAVKGMDPETLLAKWMPAGAPARPGVYSTAARGPG